MSPLSQHSTVNFSVKSRKALITMRQALVKLFHAFVTPRERRTGVPARIITIANNKGGTGKTTTAVNLSAGLAFQKGYRVLLIDFDPQGNASISLDIDIENLKHSVKDLLGNSNYPAQNLLWKKGETLRILPANSTLKDVEPELLGSVDGRLRLRARLAPIVEEFDYVIIDTPPTTGIFTQAPLIASHEVLIPVDVGYFSLQGIRQLLEEIAKVREHFNPDLQIAGILLTKFDSRTTFSHQVEKTLRNSFGDLAMKTMIRINIDLVRAQVDRQSIFAFDPNCVGAHDYQNLVNELVGNVVSFPKENKRRAVNGV
jgi:chromosome partitioning protein